LFGRAAGRLVLDGLGTVSDSRVGGAAPSPNTASLDAAGTLACGILAPVEFEALQKLLAGEVLG
jgi:hypothetical protein